MRRTPVPSPRTPLVAASLLAASLFAGCAAPAIDWSRYPVIPRPVELAPRDSAFVLDASTRIALEEAQDTALGAVAELFAEPLRRASGLPLPVGADDGGAGVILLAVRPDAGANRESYDLSVAPDRVRLAAPSGAGVFRGLQTLRQLLPPAVETGYGAAWRGSPSTLATARRPDSVVQALPEPGPDAAAVAAPASWRIPAVEIHDAPRFRYRGMHLDVGRHVFPPEFVKKYIDLLALYRFNTFHWHLTEDQGWRIEIRSHPRLTAVGGYRAETQVLKERDPFHGDATPYGGYYTQAEVRDIVAYAAARHITVIPEIELPGHSRAALAAYPELGCGDGPYDVATLWGVFPEIYCPKESTFAFLEDVLTEVMALFPSPYIHIGGDEAPKDSWEVSEVAQGIIRREGLAGEDELQSWFIGRIGRFLNEHGRQLIGWDEILEGGLTPDATVMSWRGEAGGIAAARDGHDVIMAPNGEVYLDYYQGDPMREPLAIGGYTPLEDVYAYEPVPAELTGAEARHILGAQGNVWTEYLPTSDHVEYMAFPRALALAEVTWSPAALRDWSGFLTRLAPQLAHLDALDVHYRVPPPDGLGRDHLTLEDSVTVTLSGLLPGTVVRCTTTGEAPTSSSAACDGSRTFPVGDGLTITAAAYPPDSRPSGPVRATYRRATLRPATALDEAALRPQLRVALYRGSFVSVDELDAATPVRTGTYENVGFDRSEPDGPFALRFTGVMLAPTGGVYTFHLMSDDGSRLVIDDRVVVDNDGLHAATTVEGDAALAQGWHRFEVRYFQAGGGRTLRLEVTGPVGGRMPVPAYRFRHLP